MSFLSICALVLITPSFGGVSGIEVSTGAEADAVIVVVPVDSSDTVRPKDPQTALGLSVVHTAVPLGLAVMGYRAGATLAVPSTLLFLYGATLGPCAGHFYARNGSCGASALLRAGFSAAAIAGIVNVFTVAWTDGDTRLGVALFFGGMIGLGSSMVYSIVRAPVAAKHYNERHGLRLTGVAPLVNPRDGSAGVAVQMRF